MTTTTMNRAAGRRMLAHPAVRAVGISMVVLLMVTAAAMAAEAESLAAASGAPAIVDSNASGPDHALIHTPRLDVRASLVRHPLGDSKALALPGVEQLFAEYSSSWEILWDERSDRPALISGVGIPIIPGRGNDLAGPSPPSVRELEPLLRRLMAAHPQLFDVGTCTFELREAGSGRVGRNGQLWFVELQQVCNGVPVEGAVVSFRINHGNLVQIGTERIGPVALSTEPSVTSDAALERTLETMGHTAGDVVEVRRRGALKILPILPPGEAIGQRYTGIPGQGYAHLLAREVILRLKGDDGTYRALVDARSGQVLDIVNLNDAIDVRGGIYPTSYQDPEEERWFDAVATGGSSTSLDGIYMRINDACGAIMCSDADDGTVDGVIDLGMSGGTDCTTPGYGGAGNTHAARNSHYHLTNVNRIAAQYLPSSSWLGSKLTVNTNLLGTCNAFWNGSTLNFYRSGGGCTNSAEITGVLVHEWAHGLDASTGAASDQGSAEAAADTVTMLYQQSSCIAEGTYPDGTDCYHCMDCSGVRDPADFSYHDGVSTIASTAMVTSDTGINCDRYSCPYYGYSGPMGYEGHCESYIASSAIWDLGVELRTAHGEGAGWDILEQLWYDSLLASQNAYQVVSGGQCNPSATIDGCGASNYYQVFLVADDDDGNLANGTPNACRIWDALSYHGIACGTRPVCTTACTPEPVADAGPDQVIPRGQSVLIGTPAVAGHTYLWSPSGSTEAQLTVAPSVTTTYTVTATTTCGSDSDSVIVTVVDPPRCGLDESFEGKVSGWTASGLWHLVDDSSCAAPAYSSPTHAIYYGDDALCSYAVDQSTGDLISPVVTCISTASTLTFEYLRQVESYSGAYDIAEVAIEVAGSGTWTVVWTRSSADPSILAWLSSGPIAIGSFAGQDIRVRFRFDSVDGMYNAYLGWLVDDVVISTS